MLSWWVSFGRGKVWGETRYMNASVCCKAHSRQKQAWIASWSLWYASNKPTQQKTWSKHDRFEFFFLECNCLSIIASRSNAYIQLIIWFFGYLNGINFEITNEYQNIKMMKHVYFGDWYYFNDHWNMSKIGSIYVHNEFGIIT